MPAIGKLAAWGVRQQHQSRWQASLYTIVFGKELWRYLAHRARYTVLITCLRALLHAIEFGLILYALPSVMMHAMLLRLLSLTLEGSWWGATDVMRHHIRRLYKQRHVQRIRQEIAGWLAAAAAIAAAIFAGSVLWACYGAHFSLPYAVLILAIGFQTSVRILTRTFYSGAYALKRIFMPIELIVIPEIVIFALGTLLMPVLGEWSVSLCIVISSLAVGLINYVSVRRITDFLRITPGKLFARARFSSVRVRMAMPPALAMVGVRLHDVVLIAMLQHVAAQQLLFAFYLVMPLLRGGMGWAQAMYFDLSRYYLDMFAGFRATLEKYGLLNALLLSLFFSALATAVLSLFSTEAVTITTIAAYIILYSAFGFIAISLFARRSYRLVTALCVLQYIGLWALLANTGGLAFGLMLSLMVPVIIGGGKLLRPWAPPRESVLPYFAWASALCKRRQPTRLIAMHFHPAAKRLLLSSVADAMAEEGGSACIRGHSVWVAGDAVAPSLEYDALWRLGSGFMTGAETIEATNGEAAYREGQDRGLLPLATDNTVSPQDMARQFKERFPAGIVHTPMQSNAQLLATTDADRRDILREARQGMDIENSRRSKDWFVTALYDDPYLTTLFIVPKRDTDQTQRQQWREAVEKWNSGNISRRQA